MPEIARIRDDFPILKRSLNGKPLVYLDNGATSQKPQSVIDSLAHYYSEINANIHRGAHGLGSEATAAFEQARGLLARFIGASSGNEVVFTRNATEAINLVAQSWGRANLKAGDEILISELEHHANWVPWAMIAKEKGAVLKYLPLAEDGRIDLEKGKALFTAKTRMVAVSWVSNVLGMVNPVAEIVALAKGVGAMVLLDAAQAAPHFALNLKDTGADFAAFSSHKMLGPTGVGVLWGKEAVLEAMPPYQGGGSMIEKVSKDGITWNRLPWRFEAGTPDIGGVIALGEAVKYLSALGWEAIQAHEALLSERMLGHFAKIEGLRLYGSPRAEGRIAVFSFNLEGVNAQDVGALLDSMGLALRVGNHCAQPLMSRFECAGMVRASFYLYNTLEEADALAAALAKVKGILGKETAKK
jgi:cysteine desulfurase/selenocysteine lyase